MYRLIPCLAFCFVSLGCYAQQRLTFPQVESSTYRMYTEQKWDSLIIVGRQAIHQHIDYHYLRVRMGIAYYMKKKYRRAIPQLQKALKFNSANETAKEYLYLSLINVARFEAAGKLSYCFADTTSKLMQTIHHKLIDAVAVEGGEKVSSNDSLYQNPLFASIIVNHRIGKAISFTHAFSYYRQTASWGKFWQGEYFLGCNIPIGNNLLLAPAQHFIYLSSKPYIVELQSISSVAIKKSCSFIDVSLAGSWSYMYEEIHTEETLRLTAFPFGNNKVIISAAVLANQDSLKTKTQLSYSASVTWNLSSRLCLTTAYYNGSALFANEYNGYLVNNSSDLTKSKITFSPSFRVSKHLSLYALVKYEQKNYYTETLEPTNLNFTYSTALAGVKIIL